MTPHRVQLRRIKGWRMPPNTISVARPTMYGSPFKIGMVMVRPYESLDYKPWAHLALKMGIDTRTPLSRHDSIRLFREYADRPDSAWIQDCIRLLRGHNLGCWCGLMDECHADVWLEIANR